MKRILTAAFFAAACFTVTIPASAQSLSDILGGGDTGSTVTNMLSGIFSNTNFTIADIAGDYQASGPAISFKSDNLLQKAGGIAGAAAIESKLSPYYEQYGLNSMTLQIAENGDFTMTVKKLKLTGTITEGGDKGNFEFNFKAFGKVKLGKINAYIEKSGNSLDLMFDASKLKSIVSAVANFSGMSLAKTAAGILDSYDGACIGFKMNKVGGDNNSSSGLGGLLNNVLGGGKSSSTQEVETESTVVVEEEQPAGNSTSQGINALKDILSGKKKK
ncbi:MAG: DUF4923 family protein [Muribaculaceae bacterium]|nr:DUF4923 family protein [Muribaculaceae bacterium]